MLNILVVGAGQIGSRHLQGLVSVRLDLNIMVVDISNFSLDTAKLRWVEAGGNQSHHKIEWCKKIPGDIKNIDLAIVTTSSLGRATLVEQLALSVNVNYWVFEKVLAQSRQELDLIEYATSTAKNAWVNTPRRLMTWYQKLKIEFNNKGSLKIKKSGGLWGLACNSIHYIDLINWWTGESLFSVNTSKLDKIWYKSKRLGYFEVSGELLIKFSGGTELILQSYPNKVKNIMTGQTIGVFTQGEIRKLTPTECLRLQSMPDDYFNKAIYKNKPISNTQRYKMCGNAFNKEVIVYILKELTK